MGRCKSLGSLKSFLWYVRHLSGASIWHFHILSSLTAHQFTILVAETAIDYDILVYWYGGKYSTSQLKVRDNGECESSKKEATHHLKGILSKTWTSLVAQTVEYACRAGDLGSNPGSGRSPGEGNGNQLQYSCLGEVNGQRNLAGYTLWGHRVRHMTEWLTLSLSVRLTANYLSKTMVLRRQHMTYLKCYK